MLKFYGFMGKGNSFHPVTVQVARPFQSFPKPLFQSKAKCKASDMKIIFNSDEYENSLSQKGFALSLVLKVTVFGTWKWPIEQ